MAQPAVAVHGAAPEIHFQLLWNSLRVNRSPGFGGCHSEAEQVQGHLIAFDHKPGTFVKPAGTTEGLRLTRFRYFPLRSNGCAPEREMARINPLERNNNLGFPAHTPIREQKT